MIADDDNDDLDLDGMFDEWEKRFREESDRASQRPGAPGAPATAPPKPPAAPPPAKKPAAPPPAGRPLYKPPSPEEIAQARRPVNPNMFAGFDDDDEEGDDGDGATQVTEIPQDLIAALGGKVHMPAKESPTRPPPNEPVPGVSLDVDLDLGDLDLAKASSSPPAAAATRATDEKAEESKHTVATVPPPAEAKPVTHALFSDDDEDDAFSDLLDPGRPTPVMDVESPPRAAPPAVAAKAPAAPPPAIATKAPAVAALPVAAKAPVSPAAPDDGEPDLVFGEPVEPDLVFGEPVEPDLVFGEPIDAGAADPFDDEPTTAAPLDSFDDEPTTAAPLDSFDDDEPTTAAPLPSAPPPSLKPAAPAAAKPAAPVRVPAPPKPAAPVTAPPIARPSAPGAPRAPSAPPKPAAPISAPPKPERTFAVPKPAAPASAAKPADGAKPERTFAAPKPATPAAKAPSAAPTAKRAADDDEPDLELGAETATDADWDPFDDGDATQLMDRLSGTDGLLGTPAAVVASTPADRGAAAAAKTVRHRKPRDETFRLMGREPEALAARRELLVALAEAPRATAKARLYVAAAELEEQLGRGAEALALYRKAVAADAKDLVALRALRRELIARGELAEAAQLLEAEAALPLAAEEKALVLTYLTELRLHHLGDAAAAEKAARTAFSSRHGALVPSLLLADASMASGRTAESTLAFDKAATTTTDARLSAALCLLLGTSMERHGPVARALAFDKRALDAQPDWLPAALAIARASRPSGDLDATIKTIDAIAARLPEGSPPREAIDRVAARLVHHVGNQPGAALERLANAKSPFTLRARADAARAAGDRAVERETLGVLASTAGGTDRALALVQLAELHGEAGDLDTADEALRDAALADGSLATIHVVREVLARRAGDTARLARAIGQTGGGGALVAAAKLGRDPKTLKQERGMLQQAVEEGEAPITADVLATDAIAEIGDRAELDGALRRELDRTPTERRTAPALTLVDHVLGLEQPERAESILREARDASPTDSLLLRALARLVASRAPAEAASFHLEEAASASGAHAAFIATQAARLHEAASEDPIPALERALAAMPDYLPALWACERLARLGDDPELLTSNHERQAEALRDPLEAGGHRVRAALLRAATDPEVAQRHLEETARLCPDDPLLHDLLVRLGASSHAERAAMLQASLGKLDPIAARSTRLRAVKAWEDAGDPAKAAALCRKAAEKDPNDPVVLRCLDVSELLAGDSTRMAERCFEDVKKAEGPRRIAALEALADFDMNERGDATSALLSLQSILEEAPGHLPSLRALERSFMDQGRDEDLTHVESLLVSHVGDPNDAAAHLALAARLRLAPETASGSAADDLLRESEAKVSIDLGLARRFEGVARADGDEARLARLLVLEGDQLGNPDELATMSIRAAQALVRANKPAEAVALLAGPAEGAPDHPVAYETLGRISRRGEEPRAAVDAFEKASKIARVARHRVALLHDAAILAEEASGDTDRAIELLLAAAEIDISFSDVFKRLERLLRGRDDLERLLSVAEARIAAGGDATVLVPLYLTRAELQEKLADRPGARESLRAALALDPDHARALRRLSELCIEDEDWKHATETMIRLARIAQDRDELRWVFFELGTIYDAHMPDEARAEAAYRRVLKVSPNDLDTVDRLTALYIRVGRHDHASQAIDVLVRLGADDARVRERRIALSRALEEAKDPRRAEAVLEAARREHPTDVEILRAQTELYRRQNAQPALAMHLGRSANDLRHHLAQHPEDGEAWASLVEVLGWRGRPDAARCCASAAAALGVIDVELARRVDPHGGIPGAAKGGLSVELHELIAPEGLDAATLRTLSLADEAFGKVVPFDPKSLRAEKISGRDHPLRAEAMRVAQWIDADVQILTTSGAPRAFLPVATDPVTILVGQDIVASTDERERAFLFCRAVKVASSGLSIALRLQPSDLTLVVSALVRAFDSNYEPEGVDRHRLDDLAKRIGKTVSRRARDELAALAIEMGGKAGYDPAGLSMAAAELGDRAALIALGSLPSALTALLKLEHGRAPSATDTIARVHGVRGMAEAWSLLTFAISDHCFEARQKVGADRY